MLSLGTRIASGRIAFCIAALFALAVGDMAAPRAQAQQATAEEPSASEISQRVKLRASIPGKAYSRERVIDELRDEKRKIREASQAGVEIMDAEVDAEYARMARRMDLTVAQLTQNLAEEGVSPETIKHLLRANIAWQRYQKERQQAR
jgi:peptidyl-prolyl cis-trans isomerase SurA